MVSQSVFLIFAVFVGGRNSNQKHPSNPHKRQSSAVKLTECAKLTTVLGEFTYWCCKVLATKSPLNRTKGSTSVQECGHSSLVADSLLLWGFCVLLGCNRRSKQQFPARPCTKALRCGVFGVLVCVGVKKRNLARLCAVLFTVELQHQHSKTKEQHFSPKNCIKWVYQVNLMWS